jgi:hypothetical protein
VRVPQVWELGLLNKVLQICVVAYFLSQALSPSLWSITEGPTNIINAWVEGGQAAATWAATSSPVASTYPYCSQTALYEYDFTYSAEFNYTNSRCEVMHAWELAQKLPGTVVVSTVYLDLIEEGWDCGAADAGAYTHCVLAAPNQLQPTPAPAFLYWWGIQIKPLPYKRMGAACSSGRTQRPGRRPARLVAGRLARCSGRSACQGC